MPSVSEGIVLPNDVLLEVFSILREDEVSHWDAHRRFWEDERDLSSCALVSHTWRDLAVRHLFRDLVFTHGPVIQGACAGVGHPESCLWCSCSCHWDEPDRMRREISTFLRFVQDSPHVQKAVRTLRLRISPLAYEERNKTTVDSACLFTLLASFSRLTTVYFEDMTLSMSGTPSAALPPTLSVKELVFGTLCMDMHAFEESTNCIVGRFQSVDCLRVPARLWNIRSSPADTLSEIFETRMTSLGFDGKNYDCAGSIHSFIANASSGPRSLELPYISEPNAACVQRSLDAIGGRLEHLRYQVRVGGKVDSSGQSDRSAAHS